MKSILLVEDDPLVSECIARILEGAGYQVVMARTLADARLRAKCEVFDLMLLDIGLPDGRGIELARALVKERYPAPFIFLTAYEDDAIVREAIDCGAYSYLVKPVPARQLLPIVGSALATLERHAAQTQRMASAIESNRVISAAVGILAERNRWTTDLAFETLRRWARQEEMKVELLAREILNGRGDIRTLT